MDEDIFSNYHKKVSRLRKRKSKKNQDSDANYYGKVWECDDGYLKMEELKECWCYRVISRSSQIGIWIPQRKGFLLWRQDYGNCDRLFIEYHWDSGFVEKFEVNGEIIEMNFGTVKPFFEVEKSPFRPDELFKPTSSKHCEILRYLKKLCANFPEDEEYKIYWEHIKSLNTS